MHKLGLLNEPRDAVLDSFVQAVAEYCNSPIAFLSVLHSDKQVLLSTVGLDVEDVPFEQSFCRLLLQHPEPYLEISDSAVDFPDASALFSHADQHAHFYAGHRLETSDGHVIGSLVVIDTEPRDLSEPQQGALQRLAGVVSAILEQRKAAVYDDLDNIILRNVSQGVILSDPHLPNGSITYCNDAILTITGYARAEVLGQERFFLLGHAPDPTVIEQMLAMDANNSELALPLAVPCKDGHVRWTDYTTKAIFDRDGEVNYYVSIITDTTEQKSNEVALGTARQDLERRVEQRTSQLREANRGLREVQDNLVQLFEIAPDATLVVSAEGTIESANKKAEQLFGYLQAEMIGQSIEMLLPSAQRNRHRQLRSKYLQAPEARAMGSGLDLSALHKDGHEIPVDINLSPMKLYGRSSVTASVRDVSAHFQRRELLEQERQRAEQASLGKSQFLASASHDLRQPLQSLGIYLSVLQKMQTDSKASDIADKMRTSLDATAEMLDNLLDVSRLDSGIIVAEPVDFPLQQLFDRVQIEFESLAVEKQLQLNADSTGLWVHSDPALVQQILDNLISNAIKYTEQGTVSISCSAEGGLVSVEVADTGKGISEEDQALIFDEYTQLDNPERDRRKGLGLGLAIVRKVTELLDLPLRIESALGAGTRFTLDLALATQEASNRPQTATAGTVHDHAPVKTTALLIDDDPSIVDALALCLELESVEVVTANSYESAIAELNSGFRPKLLITDFRLPGKNGLQLVAQARRILGDDLPALVITGDTTIVDPLLETLQKLAVMHKPINPDRLLEWIAQQADN